MLRARDAMDRTDAQPLDISSLARTDEYLGGRAVAAKDTSRRLRQLTEIE
jgi:hypothetical protein